MTHAEDAARLAEQIEKENPAVAGVIHALLAIAAKGESSHQWVAVNEDDDMLVDWHATVLVEDKDGSQREWLMTAEGSESGMGYWVALDDAEQTRSQTEMYDLVSRWRYV